MNHLKNAFYLLFCILCGVAIGMGIKYLRHPSVTTADTSEATGNAPPLHGFLLPPEATPNLLAAFPPLHATAVALPYTADASTLAASVQSAHALHLKVLLLPPPLPNAKNPYPQPLPKIAAQAQSAGADILCLSWLATDPDPTYWRSQLSSVRKAFSGQLLIAATPDILPGLEFLDATDLIAAIGPFDLPLPQARPGKPLDLHDFTTAWTSVLDSFESISLRYGKRGILLDVRDQPARSHAASPALEALRDEALADQTRGRDALEGLFLSWTPTPDPAQPTADPRAINHDLALVHRIADLWQRTAQPLSARSADPAASRDRADTAP